MTYLLKKLLLIEQNYNVHNKKLLAIVVFLESWKIYIKKLLKLIILTNYKNFIHFIIIKQLNKKQMR